jgi:uncharacterized protein YecT (DUF1311 family)
MKISIAVLLLALASFSCSAQKSEAKQGSQGAKNPCWDRATTQSELDHCADLDAKASDAQLNMAYSRLLDAAKGDAVRATKINAAEQAWMAYRDAYIKAMYPAENKQDYGTSYPMEADELYGELTDAHIKDVENLLECERSIACAYSLPWQFRAWPRASKYIMSFTDRYHKRTFWLTKLA